MPKRVINEARHNPIRVIIFTVAFIGLLAQIFTLTPWYIHPELTPGVATPSWLFIFLNGLPVNAVVFYGMWASWTNNLKHMGTSALLMSAIFLLSTITRIAFGVDPTNLMWLGYFILWWVMVICYLAVRFEYRFGSDSGGRDE